MALVGNPNSGKSTLFNALTGRRQHVANYPGVTVERVEGSFERDGARVTVLDLPGTYSLRPDSPDEAVAVDVVHGRARGIEPVDVVVAVLDAEYLERHLYLATQVLELGLPVVIALNRSDRLAAAGMSIDVVELIHDLGAVVVPVVADHGRGRRAPPSRDRPRAVASRRRRSGRRRSTTPEVRPRVTAGSPPSRLAPCSARPARTVRSATASTRSCSTARGDC